MSSIANVVAALQAHLQTARKVVTSHDIYRDPVEPIMCQDGTRFSVQAGRFCYCSPENDQGPWDTVEVMTLKSPTNVTPRNWENDEDGLAGWVPIEAVAQEIIDRGYIQVVIINEGN